MSTSPGCVESSLRAARCSLRAHAAAYSARARPVEVMDIEVRVHIVGGGCGLTAPIFLSKLSVDHLLVETHQTTPSLPKASYLNQRSMEILRQHGATEQVYAGGAKMSDKHGRVRWQTSLGGNGPLDGRAFFEIDGFGGGSLTEIYVGFSDLL